MVAKKNDMTKNGIRDNRRPININALAVAMLRNNRLWYFWSIAPFFRPVQFGSFVSSPISLYALWLPPLSLVLSLRLRNALIFVRINLKIVHIARLSPNGECTEAVFSWTTSWHRFDDSPKGLSVRLHKSFAVYLSETYFSICSMNIFGGLIFNEYYYFWMKTFICVGI